jgi:hypothetical protein
MTLPRASANLGAFVAKRLLSERRADSQPTHAVNLVLAAYEKSLVLALVCLVAVALATVGMLFSHVSFPLTITALIFLGLATAVVAREKVPTDWYSPPLLLLAVSAVPLASAVWASVTQSGVHSVFWSLPPSDITRLEAAAGGMILAGLLAYLAAYYTSNRPSARRLSASVGFIARYNHREIYVAGFATFFVGILIYALYVHLVGGYDQVLIFSQRRQAAQGYGYLVHGAWLLFVGALLTLAGGALNRRARLASWMMLGTATLLISTMGGRAPVIFGWLSFTLTYHYAIKRLSLRHAIAVAVLGAIFAGAFLDLRQETFDGSAVSVERVVALDRELEAHLWSAIEDRNNSIPVFMAVIDRTPDHIDYQLGRTYARILAAPIPRSVWPDKPVIDESGFVGRALLGERGYGLSPGFAGILYLNFHLPGVLIGYLLLGWFHQRVYAILESDSPLAPVAYSVTIVTMLGLTVANAVQWLLAIVPLAVIVWLTHAGIQTLRLNPGRRVR